MIKVSFSKAFRFVLTRKIDEHQDRLSALLKEEIEKIYNYVASAKKEYQKNKGTWLFWLDKKLFLDYPLRLFPPDEDITREDAREWILIGLPEELSGDGFLYNLVNRANSVYTNCKNDQNYKRALMLLRYCSSFETVNVPLDFLLWLERK